MEIKCAVGGSQQSDMLGTLLNDLKAEFMLSAENGPAVFDILKQYARQADFLTPLLITDANTAGNVTAESAAVKVSKYSTASSLFTRKKATALAVASNESLKTDKGLNNLLLDLRQQLALKLDTQFLTDVATDADTTVVATDDPSEDFQSLFTGVLLTGFARPFFIFGPYAANLLSTFKTSVDGALMYPDMSPQGGYVHGIQALVSPALTDSALLIDCNALIIAADDLEIKLTEQALIEMSDAPAMNSQTGTGAASNLVSLFQTESTGVLGVRHFASKLLRTSGAGVLNNCAWGVSS